MIVYVIANCSKGIKVLRGGSHAIIKFVRAISFTTKTSSSEVGSLWGLDLCCAQQIAERQVDM